MLFLALIRIDSGGNYMDEKNVKITTRTVIMNNGSLYVNLPKKFVKRHGIVPGDKMAMMVGENLKISPMEKPSPTL